ncbi:MAG: ABC transporter ATP-binding protein [Synergistetes bacterium]|nr:ABC transporter ATP-binding protein [Synergistota bacterium]MCX8128415.1 ABC transporter ATP-binding protein [Synergistota bacterium]MDW8192907.1 ABC transporter ATP-binding protein [Synergistota bacterium]
MDKLDILLKVEDLRKYFEVNRNFVEKIFLRRRELIRAVDGVSFDIATGETLGVIGESGSGKTTLGKLILKLLEPDSGKILFKGEDITFLSGEKLRRMRKSFQVIFGETNSLNPYMTVGEAVRHPLIIHGIGTEREQKVKVFKMFERLGLSPPDGFYYKYPNELSGWQKQKVAIARALILKPSFVLVDDPLSMLDVTVKSKLLKLLIELKKDFNLTYLFITRDLPSAKYVCDRISVMYMGRMVEIGRLKDVYLYPAHPYTKALLSSIPIPDPSAKIEGLLSGERVFNYVKVFSGCGFCPRCPFAKDVCFSKEPALVEVASGHYVACHFPLR